MLGPESVSCCARVLVVVDIGILLWMQEQPADMRGEEIVATRDANGIAVTVDDSGAASRGTKLKLVSTYEVVVAVTVSTSSSVLQRVSANA